MKQYLVQGGRALQGSVRLPAAKNSVLPLMAASLLCSGPVLLRRVPATADTATSRQLLLALGAGVECTRGGVQISAGDALQSVLPAHLAAAMRSSVFYLAPLLHKTGCVSLPLPGGCRLGPRLIDIHLNGLVRMGARVSFQPNRVTLQRSGLLHGIDYTLRIPSVGATETLMMAAACAKGTSVLRAAACEPEVQDLAAFLNRCGADIQGAGTPVLCIRGVPELHGCAYEPLPDRIIAATLACAAACAGGEVHLANARAAQMQDILPLLQKAGCGVETGKGVRITAEGRLKALGSLYTGAWPGFSTDNAPLLAAAMLRADGETRICDTLFEKRFACASQFAAMGGQVQVLGRQINITGCTALHGAAVCAPDLRGGAALVLAALGAEGETIVHDTGHIERGYPNLAAMLRRLGAEVCTRPGKLPGSAKI